MLWNHVLHLNNYQWTNITNIAWKWISISTCLQCWSLHILPRLSCTVNIPLPTLPQCLKTLNQVQHLIAETCQDFSGLLRLLRPMRLENCWDLSRLLRPVKTFKACQDLCCDSCPKLFVFLLKRNSGTKFKTFLVCWD